MTISFLEAAAQEMEIPYENYLFTKDIIPF